MARKANDNLSSWKPVYTLLTLLLLSLILIFAASIFNKARNSIFNTVETPKPETVRVPSELKANLVNKDYPTYKVPILLYHYVEEVEDKDDEIRQSLNVEPYYFEEQVKTLKDSGFTFLTAKELGEILDGKRKMPRKPVLLTFDDGHWDVDTVVLPILKKHQAKATIYLISGFLNGSDFMTNKQVRNAIDSGLVEVGAHTVHHAKLKGIIRPLVNYEISQSKRSLEDTFHIKVYSFAYPDGAFDEQAISEVKSAGFTTAVSTIPGISQSEQNKYFLFRIRPGKRVGQELLDYFNQTKFKPY